MGGLPYVPYYGPRSRSEDEVSALIALYEKLVIDYPETRLRSEKLAAKLTNFKNETLKHPLAIEIWRKDIRNLIERAGL
jgi:hypothetical protein